MLGHTYLSSFEATLFSSPSSFFFLCTSTILPLPLFLSASQCFNHKGTTGSFWWAVAVTVSLPLSARVAPQPEPEQGYNPFRQPPPKSEGMKHMLPQINHCDQSHGCTANQWSERALKIKLCPWCAQQWLCGQWCQRQPANIKQLGPVGLSVLNTN